MSIMVSQLKKMFLWNRRPRKTLYFQPLFLYLWTDEDDPIEAKGELTWYDARFRHATRTEWRLYYPTNEVTTSASAGDALFICQKKDGSVLEIITKKESIIENQLFWLFNIRPDENSGRFVAKQNSKTTF